MTHVSHFFARYLVFHIIRAQDVKKYKLSNIYTEILQLRPQTYWGGFAVDPTVPLEDYAPCENSREGESANEHCNLSGVWSKVEQIWGECRDAS